MKPVVAVVAGALISGVTMYAVGAGAAQREALPESPAFVEPLAQHVTTPAAVPAPAFVSTTSAPARAVRTQPRPASGTIYPPVQRSEREDRRYEEEERTKTKTALIIGGSAASGAGVGAIVGGKKGALAGAAIGGGAASIYEATQRR
jgi:hypothetical protein